MWEMALRIEDFECTLRVHLWGTGIDSMPFEPMPVEIVSG